MATIETKSSSRENARQKAAEMAKRIKQQQDDKKLYVVKPLLGEHKVIWFDADDYEEDNPPDNFAPKTAENPNPTRHVWIFNVKTKTSPDETKTMTLEDGQAMEVFELLSKRDEAAAWIEVSREPTKRGGSKLKFTLV
jgi:hypothetical protein